MFVNGLVGTTSLQNAHRDALPNVVKISAKSLYNIFIRGLLARSFDEIPAISCQDLCKGFFGKFATNLSPKTGKFFVRDFLAKSVQQGPVQCLCA